MANRDFFISYNSKDTAWAEWIAWILEEAGYSVVIQAWDFRPGGNFVLEMHKAAKDTQKTIAILSTNYLNAEYTQPEWAAAFVQDPKGQNRLLVPIRVEKCQLEGLLKAIIYIDLVELSQSEARQAILGAFSERRKPDKAPHFPGIPEAVPYPGINQAESVAEPPALVSQPQASISRIERLELIQKLMDKFLLLMRLRLNE